MLLVYLSQINPRNRYTIKTVLKTILKVDDFEFTADKEVFSKHAGPKLSYGKKALADEVFIFSHGLLDKKGIEEVDLAIGEHQNIPCLFSHQINASLPFDVFSAVFYMLSRYEEYLPHRRDHYDRFTAKESIAYQKNFLQIAVVDRWSLQLLNILQQKYPDLKFRERVYSYKPTIDIDNAFAYKYKGIIRSLGGFFRAITKFDFEDLKLQIAVLFGKRQDPFDTYNYQLNIQKKYYLKPLYFFLLADYGLNDKNISYENTKFQSLIKSIADYADIGIHPSFGSTRDTSKLPKEIKRLENIVKREIKKSRQHFLKISLPETYRNLIQVDIEEDYTMGFASECGFRAGTCTPYPFYDLDEELECKLTVYPFQVMESTFKYYQQIKPEEAVLSIKKMIDEVRAVNGTFISLWHNESLSDEGEWFGWRKVYEEMVRYAVQT